MQRQKFSGGGVVSKATRLRGQSTVEYVLLIAIIGLVVVFAGPPVAGAIRNQFSAVTNTLDAGTGGGTEAGGGSGGGGSADSGSSADLASAVAKDAANWTLDEQKAAADDIAKNGTASAVYAKAKAAMDAGTTWPVKLTNDETMTYRIIGINHDDLADGSGKAGLTFEATNSVLGAQRMNATNTNAGGWEASELRGRLNSGDLWALLPTELTGKIHAVTKMTDNKGGGSVGTPTATTDSVFLLSRKEIWNGSSKEGYQYDFYALKGTSNSNYDGHDLQKLPFLRSLSDSSDDSFALPRYSGYWYYGSAGGENLIYPAFCF